VATFPNVFNLQSVMLEHTKDLKQVVFVGDDKVASLSTGADSQDLIISSATDGAVLAKQSVKDV